VADVLIPTEDVVEMRGGPQGRDVEALSFPATSSSRWRCPTTSGTIVRNTPKVTGFRRGRSKPTPLTRGEVDQILHQVKPVGREAQAEVHLRQGRDQVRINEGPFTSFNGVVDEVTSTEHAEGDGDDLRPVHAGRARLPAGGKTVSA